MSTETIVEAIGDWLDANDWKYEYQGERKLFKMGVNLKCRLGHTRLFIDVKDTAYLVYAISPVSCGTDAMPELLRFCAAVNFGLMNGNFELDPRDGEMRYKCFVDCDELPALPNKIIQNSIYYPCAMMSKYGDSFTAIGMGFSDAASELKKVEPGSTLLDDSSGE